MLLKNKTEHETNGPYRLSEQTILLVHCKVYRSIFSFFNLQTLTFFFIEYCDSLT